MSVVIREVSTDDDDAMSCSPPDGLVGPSGPHRHRCRSAARRTRPAPWQTRDMADAHGERPTPRRPAFFSPVSMDSPGRRRVTRPGPGDRGRARDRRGGSLRTGRAAREPELTRRLVALVDDLGLSTLAELWAGRPARSLPGALWRLYALREWVRRDPVGASADYAAGIRFADVAARRSPGVAEPPGPAELQGAHRRHPHRRLRRRPGDRARAGGRVCRVVASGRAHRADESDARSEHDPLGGAAQTRRAASMLTTGDDLEASPASGARTTCSDPGGSGPARLVGEFARLRGRGVTVLCASGRGSPGSQIAASGGHVP